MTSEVTLGTLYKIAPQIAACFGAEKVKVVVIGGTGTRLKDGDPYALNPKKYDIDLAVVGPHLGEEAYKVAWRRLRQMRFPGGLHLAETPFDESFALNVYHIGEQPDDGYTEMLREKACNRGFQIFPIIVSSV